MQNWEKTASTYIPAVVIRQRSFWSVSNNALLILYYQYINYRLYVDSMNVNT